MDYTFEYFPTVSHLFTVFCCLFKNTYAPLSVFCEFKVFALLILGSHMFLISELITFGLCFHMLLLALCMMRGVYRQMPSVTIQAHSFNHVFIVFAIVLIWHKSASQI